jgi:hypothetical protein
VFGEAFDEVFFDERMREATCMTHTLATHAYQRTPGHSTLFVAIRTWRSKTGKRLPLHSGFLSI